jgi:DNA invertase Pin-like site-specific DNA recombinase
MNTSDLIQPRHLERRAVIYVRQSSPNQVFNNQESRRLQYALRDRAKQLGWRAQDIDVIDLDLGHTAATTEGRVGFQELVANVALGQIGILIAYDATRLARNCSHWYQLLDLCGRADSLIADRDGVYDPTSINGRLLLGLKGQISELELHTIRSRLTAGLLSKAERGELALTLPTGLVRLESGQVVKHPDREVTARIDLIFSKLLEKTSLAQTVRWFLARDLKIPRRNTAGDIHWKRPTVANLGSMVRNPAYAGAFAYGRSRWQRSQNTGKMQGKTVPLAQWRYCIRDRYPAYISWDTFEKIDAMLRDNHAEYDRNKTRGVPREGKAMLHGIAYCGACGHKMCVQYKGGTQYLCNHLRQQTGTPVCQRLPADRIDEQVVAWFFEALSAAEIDAASGVLQHADREREQILAGRRAAVERLRYQAQLAERQFLRSDPDNRLVTAELERRWEATLCELKLAEQALDHDQRQAPTYALPADLLEQLKDIGPRLPELWNDQNKLLRTTQKKALLRSLIDKVVLQRTARDLVHVRVVWRGGASTSTDVAVSVGNFAHLSGAKEMEATVLRLAQKGISDAAIAAQLTAAGHRSPQNKVVLPSTVKNIRLARRILQRPCQSHPRRVPGFLSVPQLIKKLGVPRSWIYDRIHNGTITVDKDPKTGCYLFPDKPETLDKLRQLHNGQINHVGC